ncbi:MAG: sulfatase [Phycisphaeraceae bacterium]
MSSPTSNVRTSPRKRPNVIWIFGDQHRGQALGCAGDPNVRTPNIDGLAQYGLRCPNAVAGTPWCTPFRAALLTGRYPHQVGCTRTPSQLSPEHPTIAQPLREGGYHTAWVGKWHLGGKNYPEDVPPELRGGFDYWMGFEAGNVPYNTSIQGSDHEELRELPGYQTDELTDLLIRHLRGHCAQDDYQPFFAALSVQPPHDRYVAPARFMRHNPGTLELRPNVPDVPWVQEMARHELSGYYGMIENFDWNIGRLLDALREMRIDSDTWIMFFSDHGDSHGSHGMFRKSNPYEESIRIPMIIARASPNRGDPDHLCDATINHVDITATTLGLCGIEPPAPMAGHSYHHHLVETAQDTAHDDPESAYLQQIPPKAFPQGIDVPWRGVVTRNGWKYICMPSARWLMFNLNDDPYEQANLAFNTRFMDQRRRLHQMLADWIERTGDEFEMPAVDSGAPTNWR